MISAPVRLRMQASPPRALLALLVLLSSPRAPAAEPNETAATRDVIDLAAPSAEFIPLPTQVDLVSVARPVGEANGLDVNLRPGSANYPGINFRLAPGKPDFSAFGYIEARLTNTGAKAIHVTLRVDSASAPDRGLHASETFGRVHLTPGGTGTARAYFSQPKKGMGPFNPDLLDMVLIYVGKDESHARSFRLESIIAGGIAGEAPAPATK